MLVPLNIKIESRTISMLSFNPLCANVEYTSHDGDVACSGCSVSHRQKLSRCFWKRRKFATKCVIHFIFRL